MLCYCATTEKKNHTERESTEETHIQQGKKSTVLTTQFNDMKVTNDPTWQKSYEAGLDHALYPDKNYMYRQHATAVSRLFIIIVK